MAKYLLDTNIVSYLERTSSIFHDPVKNRLESCSNGDDIFISILTIYEFHHSITLSSPKDGKKLSSFLKTLKEIFPILPLTEQGAIHFSEIKKNFQNQTGITQAAIERHNIDFMLCGAALDANAIMVSNDKIFNKIQDMNSNFIAENWAQYS